MLPVQMSLVCLNFVYIKILSEPLIKKKRKIEIKIIDHSTKYQKLYIFLIDSKYDECAIEPKSEILH